MKNAANKLGGQGLCPRFGREEYQTASELQGHQRRPSARDGPHPAGSAATCSTPSKAREKVDQAITKQEDIKEELKQQEEKDKENVAKTEPKDREGG